MSNIVPISGKRVSDDRCSRCRDRGHVVADCPQPKAPRHAVSSGPRLIEIDRAAQVEDLDEDGNLREPSKWDIACDRSWHAYQKASGERTGRPLRGGMGSSLSAADDLEVERWANEVIAGMRSGLRLRDAIEAANGPTDDMGDEELPIGWKGEAPKQAKVRPALSTPADRQRAPLPDDLVNRFVPRDDNSIGVREDDDPVELPDEEEAGRPDGDAEEREPTLRERRLAALDAARIAKAAKSQAATPARVLLAPEHGPAEVLEVRTERPRPGRSAASRAVAAREAAAIAALPDSAPCRCIHDKGAHEGGTGRCLHGDGTKFGGCECLRFRRRGGPKWRREYEEMVHGPAHRSDRAGPLPEDLSRERALDAELACPIEDPLAILRAAAPKKSPRPLPHKEETVMKERGSTQGAVLDAVRAGKGTSRTSDIIEALRGKATPDCVNTTLGALRKKGIIANDGKGTPWSVTGELAPQKAATKRPSSRPAPAEAEAGPPPRSLERRRSSSDG